MVPWEGWGSTLGKGVCVCYVEISAVIVAKEVPEPLGVFSLQANHVFTLPQRSELILTSHCRVGKLKPAIEIGKIGIWGGRWGAEFQIGLQCKWAQSLTGKQFGNMKQEG